MKPQRRRRCASCKQLFTADPRSRRQKFCSNEVCRKMSKSKSQERWRSKVENKPYWSGPENKHRVREWRKRNPKYWKRNTGS
jgi:hypothetical protein